MRQPKDRITITINREVLERIDAVCEARGQARSPVIERMLANQVREEEEFVKATEHPLERLIMESLSKSPVLIATIAKLIGEKLDPAEHAEFLKEQADRGRERVQKRKASKNKRVAGETG